MPFESKAQQRFMFSQHPKIAKRWAKGMKRKGQSIRELPEKIALDATQAPAGFWYGREQVRRLEGGTGGAGHADKNLPKNGFGTMFGTGQPKTAFDLAFSDEIDKLATSRTRAIRAARGAAGFASKRIIGVRRRWKSLGKKVKLRKGRQ